MTLNVNGRDYTVQVSDPGMPLLWVLRDLIGLTGTKYGCGIAQCGACTVLIDGVATRSCQVPLNSVGNRKVTTIEGLAQNGKLNKIQAAWLASDVPQCGYCQSGMMIAAVDLLDHNPKPTVEDIRKHFTNTPPSAHLCRCGTYSGIVAAVQRASKTIAG